MTGKKHTENTKKKIAKNSGWENNLEILKNYSIINNKTMWTEERRLKMSISACTRIKQNSKYSKTFKYKNIILDSSYELMFAEICDKSNITWEKCRNHYFPYKIDRLRHYIPDFYLPQFDLYIDTKNDFLIKKDNQKIKAVKDQNSINLIVLSLNDLKRLSALEQVFREDL